MSDLKKKALSEMLRLSRSLAERAEDGDWESVEKLQQSQSQLVEEFFTDDDRTPMTADVMSGLAHVRVYTDMVVELAKKKRKALAGAADSIKTGRNAVSAYAECS